MPLGVFFWVVYVIALLVGFWGNYEANQPLWYRRAGAGFVIWLLVGILGYAVFGPVVHR